MKLKSEILSAACGSIGGTTYQRSKAGIVRLAKPWPVNTNSNSQRAARNIFQRIAITWKDGLTQEQQDAWSSYAKLTPTTGCLGDTLVLSGHQMFLRCNSLRLQAGLPLVLDGPTVPGLVSIGPIGVVLTGGAAAFFLFFLNTTPWANEVGGALLIQTSRFLAQARNSYKAKLHLAEIILGDPIPPSGAVAFSTNAFGQNAADSQAGMKLRFRITALRADGRISSSMALYRAFT